MDAIQLTMRRNLNLERTSVALVGALMLVMARNMFTYRVAKNNSEVSQQTLERMALMLFIGGWLVMAAATTYIHSTQGYFEQLSPKTVLAFASATAIISGALLGRATMSSGREPSMLARNLYLVGWAGMLLTMVLQTVDGMRMWGNQDKVMLSVMAVITTLGGMYFVYRTERMRMMCLTTTDSKKKCQPPAQRSTLPGKLAVAGGFVMMALAIGMIGVPNRG